MTTLVCSLLLVLGAEAFDTEFQAASAAYNSGNYADAVAGYERLVASGAVNPAVFYDLGNAYYKSGRIGPAIANYERALAIRPGMVEAEHNLSKVLSETKNNMAKPLRPAWQQMLLFWDSGLTYSVSRLLALASWLGLWGLLGLQLVHRVPNWRTLAVLLLGVAMLSGLSAWCKAHPLLLAVGAEESATVRYGTSDADEERFELAAGDRVAVDERAGGWLRVRSVDGVRGWVREDQVCLVGPPYTAAPPVAAQGK
nr:BatE [uncultured bacterium]